MPADRHRHRRLARSFPRIPLLPYFNRAVARLQLSSRRCARVPLRTQCQLYGGAQFRSSSLLAIAPLTCRRFGRRRHRHRAWRRSAGCAQCLARELEQCLRFLDVGPAAPHHELKLCHTARETSSTVLDGVGPCARCQISAPRRPCGGCPVLRWANYRKKIADVCRDPDIKQRLTAARQPRTRTAQE